MPQLSGEELTAQRKRLEDIQHKIRHPDTFLPPSDYRHQSILDPVIPKDIYSPSRMDVLGMLLKIRMRPNPTYDLGVVDDRAALVVCNNEVPDAPIIYATESFEILTGYYGSEIIGKNCRFLQNPPNPRSPPWDVVEKCRKYNEPLLSELRHRIQRKEEAQVKIVNYHKDGTPFMNILTVIPIRYEDDDGVERDYIVGFQVNEKDITPSLG